MRWYWTKIVLGAVGVFVVGYGAILGARALADKGRSLFESSDPIRIPLALIPFALDGQEVGTFQQVIIRRDAPKVVQGLDARVRIKDTGLIGVLEGCRVTPVADGDFDLERGFRCAGADSADARLVEIGVVRIVGQGGLDLRLPFLLDSAAVADLRGANGVEEATARISGDQASAASRMHGEIRRHVDSVVRGVTGKAPSAPQPPPEP